MKINVVSEYLGEEKAALIQTYQLISTEQIDKLISELEKIRSAIIEETNKKDKPPKLLTAKEAAKYLGVTRQTIYNRIKAGSLKSRGIGGNHYFTHDDLNSHQLTLNYPKALCINSAICYDIRSGKVAPFRKDLFYDIIRENKKWIYLFNENWDGAIRMGKKQFRKNFSVEGEPKYIEKMYNV